MLRLSLQHGPLEMSDRDALTQVGVNVSDIPSSNLSEGMSTNLNSGTSPAYSSNPKTALSKNNLTSTNVTSAASTSLSPSSPIGLPDSVSVSSISSAPTRPESRQILSLILLLTTGQRYPYQIDEKFLESRNVNVPGTMEDGRKDPYSISIYTLKELILREWNEEWGLQPSSPSSIRLIYFGRLLEDNKPLINCRFNEKTCNVIHMTVRPQDIMDEEDASKSKILSKDGENVEPTTGCRCSLM